MTELDYWKDETLRARLDAQDSVDYWRQEAKRARAEIDCECTHVYGRVEYDAAFQNIAAERDALRDEVERVYGERNDAVDELILLRDERAAALAELERLRAQFNQYVRGAEVEADELRAQVERLRAALAECFPLIRPGTDLSRRVRDMLGSDNPRPIEQSNLIRSCPRCWGKHDEADCPDLGRDKPRYEDQT